MQLAAAWPSCWNLSLCVYYNILHFFLPLPKQQASRHLGYFKFVPQALLPPPYPNYLSHKQTGYFKRKWIHVFFVASLTKVWELLRQMRKRILWFSRKKMKVVYRLSAIISKLFVFIWTRGQFVLWSRRLLLKQIQSDVMWYVRIVFVDMVVADNLNHKSAHSKCILFVLKCYSKVYSVLLSVYLSNWTWMNEGREEEGEKEERKKGRKEGY